MENLPLTSLGIESDPQLGNSIPATNSPPMAGSGCHLRRDSTVAGQDNVAAEIQLQRHELRTRGQAHGAA